MPITLPFPIVVPEVNWGLATPNGYGRRYKSHLVHPQWQEVMDLFSLQGAQPEPMFGTFIGNHYLAGAYVHPHIDEAPFGMEHVRVNIMARKPDFGGNPVIAGVELNVNEGSAWLCMASKYVHASTPIKGGERVVLSFGALVPCVNFLNKISS